MPWIAWLIAAAALGVAEFFTLTLAFGLLAAAAVVAAVVAGLGGPLLVQVLAVRGLIKLSGEEWSARALDEYQVIPVGALVDVMEIEGATAIVYPRELLP